MARLSYNLKEARIPGAFPLAFHRLTLWDFIFILLLLFFLIFWLCRAVCGILGPRPGIEPVPPVLAAWSLNHWTTREVRRHGILNSLFLEADKVTVPSWKNTDEIPQVD